MSSNREILEKDAKKKKKKKKDKKKKSSKDEPITIRASSTGTKVGHYSIGNELGRGGFGFVYQGLDTEEGISVAIKQVYIKHVPKDELSSIKMEIELLKKLSHENIVQYIDSVEDGGTLNIVLEYVEGGSLSWQVSKYGSLSEKLVLKYLVQVLEGLAYLHRQGVIHRDIKGANILTTKGGVVKLADFGVAINFDETASEGECVVGTPYWMAPEIIKMEGVTAKCDIWSVGCVVIELLTGKPPYFELAPMAALFRIVQDVGGPPLPVGISPVLRDFLAACFMSSAESRKSAEELLKHPWCASLLRQQQQEKTKIIEKTESFESFNQILEGAMTNRGFISVADHQNVTRRRGSGDMGSDEEDWDAELGIGDVGKEDDQPPNEPSVPVSLSLPTSNNNELDEDPFGDDEGFGDDNNDFGSLDVGSGGLTLQIPNNNNNNLGGLGGGLGGGLDDIDDEDWGEDIDDNGTPDQQSAIVAQLKKQAASRKSLNSINSGTPSALEKKSLLNRFKENNNDNECMDDFDMDGFGSPKLVNVTDSNNNNINDNNVLIDDFNSSLGSVASVASGLGDDDDFDLEGVTLNLRRNDGDSGDDEMEGFDDDFDMTGFGDDDDDIGAPAKLDFGDASNFESDSKAEVEAIQIKETYLWLTSVRITETEHEREEAYQAVCHLLNAIELCPMTNISRRRGSSTGVIGGGRLRARSIVEMNNTNDPEATKENIRLEQLKVLLGLAKGQDYILREQLGLRQGESSLGPMYVLEMMNITYVPTRVKVLELLYLLVESDPIILQTFILIGMIPEIIRISIHTHDINVQIQTSKLSNYLCKFKHDQGLTGSTMRTFIACGGLPMLVDLMRIPYVEPKTGNNETNENKNKKDLSDPRLVVRLAIDSSRRVLDVKAIDVNVHKNEMCRKFAQAGMLPVLTDAMLAMCQVAKEDTSEWMHVHYLAKILHIFCNYGDITVKAHVVEPKVMRNALKIIDIGMSGKNTSTFGPIEKQNMMVLVEQLVKCIRVLSMVLSPAVINALQKQNVIPVLVSFLPTEPLTNSNNLQNMAIGAIYHLCRLSPPRQEQAAVAGIVPRLKFLFKAATSVWALDLFCDLARASDTCREQLGKYGGVDVYLKYIDDRNLSRKCLTSLVSWLSKDIELVNSHGIHQNSFVEHELLRPNAIKKLINLFKREKTNSSEFEGILTPMLDMLSKSIRLNRALGRSPIFVDEIAKRLIYPNNVVRMNLLRMLKLIMEQHSELKKLILRFDLYPKIQQLAEDSSLATVSFFAGQLLEIANIALFGDGEKDSDNGVDGGENKQ